MGKSHKMTQSRTSQRDFQHDKTTFCLKSDENKMCYHGTGSTQIFEGFAYVFTILAFFSKK